MRVRTICWIRRDLRLNDHSALARATELGDSVAVVFVFDRNILDDLRNPQDRRLTFIMESLLEIQRDLRARGSDLLVRIGDPLEEIPRLASEIGAKMVVTARDGDPYAIERDKTVDARLSEIGIGFETVRDVTILEAGQVFNQSELPFRVYTPYSKAWRVVLDRETDLAPREPNFGHLAPAASLKPFERAWGYEEIGFVKVPLWIEPGERAAAARLDSFALRMSGYGDDRDFPAIDGTSTLSTDLRFGTISIRECARRALEIGTPGAEKWYSELIWREFYHDVLGNFPHVVETTFDPVFRDTEWPGTRETFERWCAGETGYPIVDASMRHFNATGWMHNRNRMIVASFLTKHLLCNWQWGEDYFARHLLDFDLAQNNGGWQWAASTGVDSQPYFRIFNPYLQSKKFDGKGDFIRMAVPELAGLTAEQIHQPTRFDLAAIGASDYPMPIVDHEVGRARALEFLSAIKKLDPGKDG